MLRHCTSRATGEEGLCGGVEENVFGLLCARCLILYFYFVYPCGTAAGSDEMGLVAADIAGGRFAVKDKDSVLASCAAKWGDIHLATPLRTTAGVFAIGDEDVEINVDRAHGGGGGDGRGGGCWGLGGRGGGGHKGLDGKLNWLADGVALGRGQLPCRLVSARTSGGGELHR